MNMRKIVNLTQHNASPEQIRAGVVDVTNHDRLKSLLTVDMKEFLQLSETGQSELLRFRAATILAEFVTPVLIEQCEALLLSEWSHGSENTATPLAGVSTYNAIAKAMTVHLMIGGAPYLTDEISRQAEARGFQCHYALSDRVSEEVEQPDGTVKKVAVFKHVGFYPAI